MISDLVIRLQLWWIESLWGVGGLIWLEIEMCLRIIAVDAMTWELGLGDE